MTEETTYTMSQAHLLFATDFHGKTWELLDKKQRTPIEDELMLDYAHASMAHWRAAGTSVRHQRGEWLLARTYAVVGAQELAVHHARRCLQLLESNQSEMEDFDFAFAYEALARALAIKGENAEAKKYIEMAQKAGEALKSKEDRDVFFGEFNGGNWNGLK